MKVVKMGYFGYTPKWDQFRRVNWEGMGPPRDPDMTRIHSIDGKRESVVRNMEGQIGAHNWSNSGPYLYIVCTWFLRNRNMLKTCQKHVFDILTCRNLDGTIFGTGDPKVLQKWHFYPLQI